MHSNEWMKLPLTDQVAVAENLWAFAARLYWIGVAAGAAGVIALVVAAARSADTSGEEGPGRAATAARGGEDVQESTPAGAGLPRAVCPRR